MKLEREHAIPASQSRVWGALNDPEILKEAIPGCESVERLEDGSFRASVKLKVGPISAAFVGRLSFADVDAPNGYTIHFEGQGGAAGYARGQAAVQLRSEDAHSTVLTYQANTQIGGRLAQVGARLIEGVASKTSESFFDAFSTIVASKEPARTDTNGDAGQPLSSASDSPVGDRSGAAARPSVHIKDSGTAGARSSSKPILVWSVSILAVCLLIAYVIL